jgi:ribosomal protein S27AE
MKTWLGSPGNQGRAMLEDMKTHGQGRVFHPQETMPDPDVPCPRCNCFMVLIAEHAFMELWECPQCGYLERIKQ